MRLLLAVEAEGGAAGAQHVHGLPRGPVHQALDRVLAVLRAEGAGERQQQRDDVGSTTLLRTLSCSVQMRSVTRSIVAESDLFRGVRLPCGVPCDMLYEATSDASRGKLVALGMRSPPEDPRSNPVERTAPHGWTPTTHPRRACAPSADSPHGPMQPCLHLTAEARRLPRALGCCLLGSCRRR